MKYLFAALAVLLLVGCSGSRTRLNPGADLAWYEGSAQWMFDHLPPGCNRATAFLGGYYDPTDGSITTNEQLNRTGFFRVGMHELGIHAFNHQKPADMEELMRRYESPAFSFGFHYEEERQAAKQYLDTIPDPLAVQRAIEAARQAAAAEAKP